jgi:hypothetical protein
MLRKAFAMAFLIALLFYRSVLLQHNQTANLNDNSIHPIPAPTSTHISTLLLPISLPISLTLTLPQLYQTTHLIYGTDLTDLFICPIPTPAPISTQLIRLILTLTTSLPYTHLIYGTDLTDLFICPIPTPAPISTQLIPYPYA